MSNSRGFSLLLNMLKAVFQSTTKMQPPFGVGAERYRNSTLLDSFGVVLPKDTRKDLYLLTRLALSKPPVIFRVLMAIRDRIMSVFGVHTSTQMRQLDRRHIDFFPLLSLTNDEIELGLDDVHLDFRAYITLGDTDEGLVLQATTAAKAHNLLGRIYLAMILPFHMVIVRASLVRLLLRLDDPAWRSIE